MSNSLTQRPDEYKVSIPSDWAAFFMYLCVNANSEKAWQKGLAGSSIAEQLCKTFRLPYNKAQVVASLGEIKFCRITLVVDYREINELAKFSCWCTEEIDPAMFRFLHNDNIISCLNHVSLNGMRECLRIWREYLGGNGEMMPKDCGEIFIDVDPENIALHNNQRS